MLRLWLGRLLGEMVLLFVCSEFVYWQYLRLCCAIDPASAHSVLFKKKKKKKKNLPELLSDFLSGSICSVQLDAVSVHFHPKLTRHMFSMGQSGRPSGTILKHAMMCVLGWACETTGMLGKKKKKDADVPSGEY